MNLSRRIRRVANRLLLLPRRAWYLHQYPASSPGSVAWLVGTEIKYGGYVSGVRRNKTSPLDPRPRNKILSGGMTGGDRMLHHAYAPVYARCLAPLARSGRPVTLAEFGILKGTGLAMWCDLFPGGRILGFDIDLDHTRGNMDNLRALGAFRNNQPELHEFDQFVDNTDYLGSVLNGARLDVCIDDGFHSNESILTTLRSVKPHLADDFIYIIEDNDRVHAEIAAAHPEWTVESHGELTVVLPRR